MWNNKMNIRKGNKKVNQKVQTLEEQTADIQSLIDSGELGGLSINPNHFFADNTARDTYFVANPTEKEVDTFISVGVGYQQWDGTIWQDKTAVVKGAKGDKGDTGATGATGEQGIQGLQGIQGIQGETGAQGEQGIQGIQGVQGETGATGSAGTNGTNGVDGVSYVENNIVAVTGNKTLSLTDATTYQNVTAASVITIPPNSSVSFNLGAEMTFFADTTGEISFVAGAGVTIKSGSKLKINGQDTVAGLKKVATDTWHLFGSLKA